MNKRMKDIKDKSTEELAALLAEKRESLRTLRFGAAGARPKNPSEAITLRADIARILTARNAAK